jgi:hypothetical protein
MTEQEGIGRHQPARAVHADDRPWELLRWPGQCSKMLVHPTAERPTDPNAGLVRYEPGSHHPFHKHEFAQVWYIVEGQFRIGDRTYGPGTMLFYPDPHYEDPLTRTPAVSCSSSSTRAPRRAAARSTRAGST